MQITLDMIADMIRMSGGTQCVSEGLILTVLSNITDKEEERERE